MTSTFSPAAITRDPRALSTAILMTICFLAGIFPTLGWLEFSNSAENLNVATALEIRRTGHWLVPTLQGDTRLAKPPLPAWLTAVVITPQVLAGTQVADRTVRDTSFEKLAVEVRSLALLCAGVTLMATFGIGRLLFDDDVGLVSLIIVATNLLMLRFGRISSTDIQLAMWVALANLMVLLAITRQQWWLGMVGGGAALALAVMSKGPVSLVQTVVPMGVYYAIAPRRIRPPILPLLCGALTFLVLGLTWYALVLLRVPNALHAWKLELMGHPEINARTTSPFTYLILLPYLSPWLIMFAAALIAGIKRFDPHDRLLLALIVVPIAVMSCFPERFERYLLPMISACAVLTARFVVHHVRAPRWSTVERWINAGHWLNLAILAIAFPIAGSWAGKWIHQTSRQPWYTHLQALQAVALAAAILTVAILLQKRSRTALILATGVMMIGLQSLFMAGYARSSEGKADFKPMADLIWSIAPDAETFNAHPRGKRPPTDLALYLSRQIQWVPDASAIEQTLGSKILLMLQDKGQPEPDPGRGWQVLKSQASGSDHWWVFILPGKEFGNQDR